MTEVKPLLPSTTTYPGTLMGNGVYKKWEMTRKTISRAWKGPEP